MFDPSTKYFILSLKWTRREDRVITWWGPNDNGYVFRLNRAGVYTGEMIEAHRSYYDNPDHTIPVPCEAAFALGVEMGTTKCPRANEHWPATDLVVPYKCLRSLRAKFGGKAVSNV